MRVNGQPAGASLPQMQATPASRLNAPVGATVPSALSGAVAPFNRGFLFFQNFMQEKLEPCALLVGMENGELHLWKIVWSLLKKFQIELPSTLAIPLLGIYPKEVKSRSQRDI